MGIVNRTKDASEQRVVFDKSVAAVATGVTHIICAVPWPCVVDGGELFAVGVSGSPTYQVSVERFIVGTGATSITIATGSSNAPGAAFGTSGPLAMKFAASGSTLLNLIANDVLMVTTGGSNAASALIDIQIALRPIQDVKVHWGAV